MVLEWLFRNRRSTSAGPLRLAVEPGTKVYAIGDIHGRADLLYRLLEMITDHAETVTPDLAVRLVFLGDYIDRGIMSRETLAAVRRIQRMAQSSVRFLKGNHEAALLSFLDDPSKGAGWLGMGALQTFESYGVQPPPFHSPSLEDLVSARDRMRAALGDDEDFLRWSLVRWARSGNIVFAHAGVEPGTPLELQSDDALIWGGPVEFMQRRGLPGLVVVHGHTVTEAPDEHPWRIGVDTGAYFSGRLTALWIDDRSYGFLST